MDWVRLPLWSIVFGQLYSVYRLTVLPPPTTVAQMELAQQPELASEEAPTCPPANCECICPDPLPTSFLGAQAALAGNLLLTLLGWGVQWRLVRRRSPAAGPRLMDHLRVDGASKPEPHSQQELQSPSVRGAGSAGRLPATPPPQLREESQEAATQASSPSAVAVSPGLSPPPLVPVERIMPSLRPPCGSPGFVGQEATSHPALPARRRRLHSEPAEGDGAERNRGRSASANDLLAEEVPAAPSPSHSWNAYFLPWAREDEQPDSPSTAPREARSPQLCSFQGTPNGAAHLAGGSSLAEVLESRRTSDSQLEDRGNVSSQAISQASSSPSPRQPSECNSTCSSAYSASIVQQAELELEAMRRQREQLQALQQRMLDDRERAARCRRHVEEDKEEEHGAAVDVDRPFGMEANSCGGADGRGLHSSPS
mmetsp:Transcript_33237/g.98962  ORF Transcript_33237/g.98962 Transcript_33237/m.98962 type:complete len:426 (-) Transcript_33237:41-1318(-)